MEVATLHTLASTTPLLPYYLNATLNDATKRLTEYSRASRPKLPTIRQHLEKIASPACKRP